MYTYTVTNIRVVDGDTVDCDIDLGFGIILSNQRVRLSGVDTPEKRTRIPWEKEIGTWATDYVKRFFSIEESDYKLFSHEYNPTGKYGRILGDFTCSKAKTSLTHQLLENRLAVYYGGQKKADLIEEHYENYKYHTNK